MTKHFKSNDHVPVSVPASRSTPDEPPQPEAPLPAPVPVPVQLPTPAPVQLPTPIHLPTPDPTPSLPDVQQPVPEEPQPRRSTRVRNAPDRLVDKMTWGTKSYDNNAAVETNPSSITDNGHLHHWYPEGGGGITEHAWSVRSQLMSRIDWNFVCHLFLWSSIATLSF